MIKRAGLCFLVAFGVHHRRLTWLCDYGAQKNGPQQSIIAADRQIEHRLYTFFVGVFSYIILKDKAYQKKPFWDLC